MLRPLSTVVLAGTVLFAGCGSDPIPEASQMGPPEVTAGVMTTTTVTAVASPASTTTVPAPATTPGEPECGLGDALDAVWQAVVGEGHGTAFHLGDGTWTTAAHVVGTEPLRTRHERGTIDLIADKDRSGPSGHRRQSSPGSPGRSPPGAHPPRIERGRRGGLPDRGRRGRDQHPRHPRRRLGLRDRSGRRRSATAHRPRGARHPRNAAGPRLPLDCRELRPEHRSIASSVLRSRIVGNDRSYVPGIVSRSFLNPPSVPLRGGGSRTIGKAEERSDRRSP